MKKNLLGILASSILATTALGQVDTNFPAGTKPVGLEWTKSPSPEVTDYRIYWGFTNRVYKDFFTIPTTGPTNTEQQTYVNVPAGTKLFFTATAYCSTNGAESDYCNEVEWDAPPGAVLSKISFLGMKTIINYTAQKTEPGKNWYMQVKPHFGMPWQDMLPALRVGTNQIWITPSTYGRAFFRAEYK